MLAAFLAHCPDVLHRMRARHFRDELREKLHFGSRSLQHLIAKEHEFLQHYPLCAEREFKCALIQFRSFRLTIDGYRWEPDAVRSDSSAMAISEYGVLSTG